MFFKLFCILWKKLIKIMLFHVKSVLFMGKIMK